MKKHILHYLVNEFLESMALVNKDDITEYSIYEDVIKNEPISSIFFGFGSPEKIAELAGKLASRGIVVPELALSERTFFDAICSSVMYSVVDLGSVPEDYECPYLLAGGPVEGQDFRVKEADELDQSDGLDLPQELERLHEKFPSILIFAVEDPVDAILEEAGIDNDLSEDETELAEDIVDSILNDSGGSEEIFGNATGWTEVKEMAIKEIRREVLNKRPGVTSTGIAEDAVYADLNKIVDFCDMDYDVPVDGRVLKALVDQGVAGIFPVSLTPVAGYTEIKGGVFLIPNNLVRPDVLDHNKDIYGCSIGNKDSVALGLSVSVAAELSHAEDLGI